MIEIRCPRCGGRAEFDEPFQFLTAKNVKTTGTAETGTLHRWGGWYVREKYPTLFPWRPPRSGQRALWRGASARCDPGGYRLLHHGVVRCAGCHGVPTHRLAWPDDAYFRWSLRGRTLWAWDAEHARVLLHYVESTLRDSGRYGGGYRRSLEKLPAVFLAARNRAPVGSRIRRTLAAAGITSLDPPLRTTDAAPPRRRHATRSTGLT
ncbi:MAG TPA: hypothetical protein VEW03_08520 [Longimicrobiaceae bacterium]|nr:hypothetical protein [Longimicrobiaceae bacterium]